MKTIYDVADDLPEDHTSVLDIDNNMRVLRVTYQLHRRCSTQQERFDANRRLGEQTNSLHAFTRHVMLLDQEHGKWGGTGGKAEPDCELTKAQVEQLEAQAVERIAKAAGDGTLQSNPRQAGILQYWIALGGADGARCTSGGDRGER